MSRHELENKMAVLLGGRAAEALVFEEISTGASDDLNKATEIARDMVTRYGMDDSLGHATYEDEPSQFLGDMRMPRERRYSEETATAIDNAVRKLIARAFERAGGILRMHRTLLDETAKRLLEKETLLGEELPQLPAATTESQPLASTKPSR